MIGAVVRDDKVIIPHGNFKVKLDDNLIIFARTDAFARLAKLIRI